MSDVNFDGLPKIKETPKARVQAISYAINQYLSEMHLTSIVRTKFDDGTVLISASIHASDMSLQVDTYVAENPLSIRITVLLPVTCFPQYSLLVDEYITNFNYNKRFGVLKRLDRAVEYEHTFCGTRTFSIYDYGLYLIACLYSATEASPELAKICVGKFSKAKIAESFDKISTLINALND
ncbi:MAG: hypothetical protein LBT59_27530 [Clostridiales bacterium]|jgi:hypothetical protein|nr:hypothetical protein [Clostridiales bacterium]